MTVSDAEISGTFAADCSYVVGAIIDGQLDTRADSSSFVGLVGTSDPDEICALISGFGTVCGPCTTEPTAEYCIDILIEDITAEQTGDLLECVSPKECHVECSSSLDNPECDTSDFPVCETD